MSDEDVISTAKATDAKSIGITNSGFIGMCTRRAFDRNDMVKILYIYMQFYHLLTSIVMLLVYSRKESKSSCLVWVCTKGRVLNSNPKCFILPHAAVTLIAYTMHTMYSTIYITSCVQITCTAIIAI